MRLIDADVLPRHGNRGGLVWWKDIEEAPSRDGLAGVHCCDCKYCAVLNQRYLYARCMKHGMLFEPFEDDTRTHFCAWGIKTDRKTEPQTEREGE